MDVDRAEKDGGRNPTRRSGEGAARLLRTYEGTSTTVNEAGAVDLEAVAARLAGVGPYTYEDARVDMRALIAMVQRLEEQQAAAAHLIKLAIVHGASPLAIDRLDDALIELGRTA